jgi:hypothetical protein
MGEAGTWGKTFYILDSENLYLRFGKEIGIFDQISAFLTRMCSAILEVCGIYFFVFLNTFTTTLF